MVIACAIWARVINSAAFPSPHRTDERNRVGHKVDGLARLDADSLPRHRDQFLPAGAGEYLGFGAGRLDHRHPGGKAVRSADSEMLGADAIDGGPSEAGGPEGSGSVAPLSVTKKAPPFTAIRPFRRFIAGEPMKPA